MNELTIPRYSQAEECCNCATHIAGAGLTVYGTYELIRFSQTSSFVICTLIYGVSIFTMFLISALYHAIRDQEVKGFVRKFDHALIYFAIGGTYVPIINALSLPRTETLVWYGALGLCALAGAVFSFITLKHKYVTTVVYLIMGWASLLLLKQLWNGADRITSYLLIAGGAVYSLGAVFYLIRKSFMHTLFHIFVLGGAVLHYLAIRTLY